MAWQDDIAEQLQEAQEVFVRYDTEQDLTAAEKARAKNNIDITDATVELISGSDYKLIVE